MAEIPTGAVTFLFRTSKGRRGSSSSSATATASVLADHQRLLRAAFARSRRIRGRHAGRLVLHRVRECARGTPRRSRGPARPAVAHLARGVEIKVRMGLHTGQAVASDGRYTGLAVHRAARIGAAGHGGQILVSQATQTLLEDEEEDLHVFLRDLGEQRLKDLDRPVRLYQAAAEGLPASFPPVRVTPRSHRQTRRRSPPSFWRRRPALAAAVALALVRRARRGPRPETGSSGGLSAIQANHVGVIDPQTNEIVAEVPVGIRPGPIAAGAGSIWVGNLAGPHADEDRSGPAVCGGDDPARATGRRQESRSGSGGVGRAWRAWAGLAGRSPVRPGDGRRSRGWHGLRLTQRQSSPSVQAPCGLSSATRRWRVSTAAGRVLGRDVGRLPAGRSRRRDRLRSG